MTGGLDDTQLRKLEERLSYLRELEDRRAAIFKSIDEQGKMTDDLSREIAVADTKARLEDLYLPYQAEAAHQGDDRARSRARALADLLLADPTKKPLDEAAAYVNAEKGVADVKAALEGARDILSERFAENADLLARLRDFMWEKARLVSKVMEGKQDSGAKFSDYFDAAEPIAKVPSHRALAMFRGQKEEILALNLAIDEPEDRKALNEAERIDCGEIRHR